MRVNRHSIVILISLLLASIVSCKNKSFVESQLPFHREFFSKPLLEYGETIFSLDSLIRRADTIVMKLDTTSRVSFGGKVGGPKEWHPGTSQKPFYVFNKPFDLFQLSIPANISHCIFTNEVRFGYNNVLKDTEWNCSFHFDRLHFYAPLYFYNNKTFSDFSFYKCHFRDTLIIVDDSSFTKPIIFYSSTFGNLIQIGSMETKSFDDPQVKIKSEIIFDDCDLGQKLAIYNLEAEETSKLEIRNSFLPDTLDFSNCYFRGTIDLTESLPNIHKKKCEINLLNCDFDKVKLRYDDFHLNFNENMLNNSQYTDKINSTYQLLLANFTKNGYKSSYRNLDIEYKRWQSRENWFLKISDLWWKFGYTKQRILFFTILFLILFSFFNFIKYNELQDVYCIEGLKLNNFSTKSNLVLRVIKKYFVVLLYTGIIFFRFGIDYKNVNFKPLKYVLVIVIEYTFGLVCTGFLINWIISG